MLAWARMELPMLLKTHLVLPSDVPCGPICGFASSTIASRMLQIQLSMMLKFGTKNSVASFRKCLTSNPKVCKAKSPSGYRLSPRLMRLANSWSSAKSDHQSSRAVIQKLCGVGPTGARHAPKTYLAFRELPVPLLRLLRLVLVGPCAAPPFLFFKCKAPID